MAKTLMTNRQRKLYQKHEETENTKKATVNKLKIKRKTIEKSKAKMEKGYKWWKSFNFN